MRIHGFLKTVRIPIIDSMRSWSRFYVLFGTLILITFCLYKVNGPNSEFFKAKQVIEDISANVCLDD